MNPVQLRILRVLSNTTGTYVNERHAALDRILWDEVPYPDGADDEVMFFRNVTDVTSQVDAQMWIDKFIEEGNFCKEGIKSVVEQRIGLGLRGEAVKKTKTVTMTLEMEVEETGDESHPMFNLPGIIRQRLLSEGVQCYGNYDGCSTEKGHWNINKCQITAQNVED